MKLFKLFALISLFSMITISCGDDNPLDAAWAKFEDQKYTAAHAEFTDLLSSEGSAALVGLGWTTLKMDSMTASDRYFDEAKDDSIVDGYAGWSFVMWVLSLDTTLSSTQKREYALSMIKNAAFTLRKESNYVFTHDRTVTDEDLRLHQAYGYFYLEDYSSCILKIREFPQEKNFPLTSTPQQILIKLEELKIYAN